MLWCELHFCIMCFPLIKGCVTAVVIDGVVLVRFLSLDVFVFVYKDVHVGCFIVYKEVL